jgi:hypothetical protein
MESTGEKAGWQEPSKAALWTGRGLSAFLVLFMCFDGVTKVMKIAAVMQGSAQIQYPARLIVGTGILLLCCTAIYAIPRTSVLGAILLTGYLGGGVVINLRAGSPSFETIFPAIFGALLWAALFLREPRLRVLIPLRTATASQPAKSAES